MLDVGVRLRVAPAIRISRPRSTRRVFGERLGRGRGGDAIRPARPACRTISDTRSCARGRRMARGCVRSGPARQFPGPWRLCLAAASIGVLIMARTDALEPRALELEPHPRRAIAPRRPASSGPGRPDLGPRRRHGREPRCGARRRRTRSACARALDSQKIIGGVDSPAVYLPSLATQAARRAQPAGSRATLARNLALAVRDLPLDAGQLGPFESDVETARRGPLMSAADLEGTSMAAGLESLTMHSEAGWSALLPLHAADPSRPLIDIAQVRLALAAAHCGAEVARFEARIRRALLRLPARRHAPVPGRGRSPSSYFC